ncbi:amidohydrolase [Thalassococcus sp. S3]|uniref:amidohydrolase n=1 Tax=Thalassococcus sp. S3 TaxID=2017482 RepID=UPI0010245E78|nr:amidohydrolase [Thalassococcus sp. S3]QBF30306.1 amidohydrolase [Thalassococcus sp. S3]
MSTGVFADLVLTGGHIWCGKGLDRAEAVALWGGRVLATGAAGDLSSLIGPQTEVVDLAGRFAMPGLNDAHMHLIPYGTSMAEMDFRPSQISTLAELLDIVRDHASRAPAGSWLIGRGYDHFKLDVGRHPYREELDQVAPDHPVYIVRTCGHLAVVNSRALELAGITEDTPSPPGGLIERQNGKLTGLLAENGRDGVMNVLPPASVDDLVGSIERGGHDLLSHGITSCMEAAVGIRDGWTEMLAYQKAHRERRLPVRVYATLMGDKTRNVLPEAMGAGMISGAGDDMFRVGPVKIFTDGSAGGRTAAMTRPYLGGEDKGLLCLPSDELNEMVAAAHDAGYRMAIHAIGDAAIDQVLNALEAALKKTPDPHRRHRIEHCGWLRPDQMERMVAAHILPAPQPAFLYYFGDLYLTLLERDRIEASHPMRTWLDRGLHPSASTDCPVVEIDPRPNLYTMTTRKTQQGTLLGPEQALTLDEALEAYTYAGAYAAHEEEIKGRLTPGQLGDVAVFDTDFFAALEAGEPERLLEAQCDLTILGGEVVYRREGAAT